MEQSQRFAIIEAMREPSPRSSRLAIAGGLVAAVALAGAGFLLGRTTLSRPEPPQAAPSPISTPAVLPKPPEPQVLGRADIIALANEAAGTFAAGDEGARSTRASQGQRVELVLPFGCEGPSLSDSNAPMRWTYDADRERLHIHVDPVVWELTEWGMPAPEEATARLEGFWIARPWATAERCPKSNARSLIGNERPVTLPGQTVAVAQTVAEDRGQVRGFDIVKRMPLDSSTGAQGFHLRLAGRLGPLPNGELVRCIQPAGIEQRPLCLVGVTVDEVRIENPRDGEVLGSWPVRAGARKPG